jgi:hypothetical protein
MRLPPVLRKLALTASVLAALGVVHTGVVQAGGANAVPTPPLKYGGGCILYPHNRAATVDSLRFRCNWAQQDRIYLRAQAGAVPMGPKNGWVIRPPLLPEIASGIWMGKTFRTGPNGGALMNLITGARIEGFPAYVYQGRSRIDGKPSWVFNYTPSLVLPVYDEVREVTPGVWMGFNWWQGIFNQPQLLGFARA